MLHSGDVFVSRTRGGTFFHRTIVEMADGDARAAERVAQRNFDLFAIYCPGLYSVDAVDRLLVMVAAVDRRR